MAPSFRSFSDLCSFVSIRGAVALSFSVTLLACYSENPESGVIDLSKVPTRVAVLVPVAGTTVDFLVSPLNTARDLVVVLFNAGPYPATHLGVSEDGTPLSSPFSFKGGEFPGTGGTCTDTLGPQGTCELVLSFQATTVGSFSATLPLEYNNGVLVAPLEISLVGKVGADLRFTGGSTFSFGAAAVNGTQDKTITVTNSGDEPATLIQPDATSPLAAPYTFKDGTFPGTGGTCTADLAKNASCTLVVTFAPTVAGASTSALTLSYNYGGALTTAVLSLNGSTPAVLGLSDGPVYDFGSHANGSSSTKSFTLTNTGATESTLLREVPASALASPFGFMGGIPGVGGTCGATLAPGATCALVVTFNPVSGSPGAVPNTPLLLEYDNGLGAGARNTQVTLDLTGTEL